MEEGEGGDPCLRSAEHRMGMDMGMGMLLL